MEAFEETQLYSICGRQNRRDVPGPSNRIVSRKEQMYIFDAEPEQPGPSCRIVPSQVSKAKHHDPEIIYTEMDDDQLLCHVKALVEEISRRPSLNKSIPPISSQVTEEMIDSKNEHMEQEYLMLHINSSGVEYDHNNRSYTWNSSRNGSTSNNDEVRQVNELNQYGNGILENNCLESLAKTQFHVEPEPVASTDAKRTHSKFSQKYWNRKGGDPVIDGSCSICGKRFNTIRTLLDHRLEVHSEKAMLECGSCRKSFQKRTHIFLHLSQEYNIYRCPHCKISFASKWHIDKHKCKERDLAEEPDGKRMKTNDDGSEIVVKEEIPDEDEAVAKFGAAKQNFVCIVCGKRYTHMHWLDKHKAKCAEKSKNKTAVLKTGNHYTTSNSEDFQCKLCFRRYNSLFWFQLHKGKCHVVVPSDSPSIPKISCKHCHRTYQTEYWLAYHEKNCRANVSVAPGQSETGQEPSSSSRLESGREMPQLKDQEAEEPVEPKIEVMDEEEDETDDRDESNSTTTQRDKLKCGSCDFVSSGVTNLLSHRKNVHGRKEMLTCGQCRRKFNAISTIARHIGLENSLFVCKTCGRNCGTRATLEHHDCSEQFKPRVSRYSNRSVPEGPYTMTLPELRDHTYARPPDSRISQTYRTRLQREDRLAEPTIKLHCYECTETFELRSELIEHRQSLHGREVHQCSFCPSRFPSARALHDHHMLELSMFQCSKCDTCFPTKPDLLVHMTTCTKNIRRR